MGWLLDVHCFNHDRHLYIVMSSLGHSFISVISYVVLILVFAKHSWKYVAMPTTQRLSWVISYLAI